LSEIDIAAFAAVVPNSTPFIARLLQFWLNMLQYKQLVRRLIQFRQASFVCLSILFGTIVLRSRWFYQLRLYLLLNILVSSFNPGPLIKLG